MDYGTNGSTTTRGDWLRNCIPAILAILAIWRQCGEYDASRTFTVIPAVLAILAIWQRTSSINLTVNGHEKFPTGGHENSPRTATEFPRYGHFISPDMATEFPRYGQQKSPRTATEFPGLVRPEASPPFQRRHLQDAPTLPR